jgi:hypothetical protein
MAYFATISATKKEKLYNIDTRLSGLNLTFIRLMSGRREKLYGNEEGHHNKNEVRKEKWIRKTYRKSMGAQWYVIRADTEI